MAKGVPASSRRTSSALPPNVGLATTRARSRRSTNRWLQLALVGLDVGLAHRTLGGLIAALDRAGVGVGADQRVHAALGHIALVAGAALAVVTVAAALAFALLAGVLVGALRAVITGLALVGSLLLAVAGLGVADVVEARLAEELVAVDLRGRVEEALGRLAALVAIPGAVAQVAVVLAGAVDVALALAGVRPTLALADGAEVALGAGVVVVARRAVFDRLGKALAGLRHADVLAAGGVVDARALDQRSRDFGLQAFLAQVVSLASLQLTTVAGLTSH